MMDYCVLGMYSVWVCGGLRLGLWDQLMRENCYRKCAKQQAVGRPRSPWRGTSHRATNQSSDTHTDMCCLHKDRQQSTIVHWGKKSLILRQRSSVTRTYMHITRWPISPPSFYKLRWNLSPVPLFFWKDIMRLVSQLKEVITVWHRLKGRMSKHGSPQTTNRHNPR